MTRRRRNDTPSPERVGAGRKKDLSPPRRRQRRDTPSPEPVGVAGKDTSPPRQRRRRQDTLSPKGNGAADQDDMSPPRRRARNDSEEPQDLELPRRRVRHDSEEPKDMSPPRRRTRHDSEEPKDMSPPRRRTRHDSEGPKDMSPPRRRTRHDSEEPKDFFPPRRRSRHDSEVPKDMSPPRKRKHDDLSPPRRRNLGRSPEGGDISPPRKGRKVASDDLSPPRKERDLSPPRKGKKEGAPKQARKAGLMTAEEVKEDIRKIKEDEMRKFASQDPSLVGKGAKAVFRDKEGRWITEEEMRKAKESEKPKEIHIEWGTGLAQKREAEARLKELEAEKSKPFARTRDDPELDAMLKNRLRWGDPMAHLVKRKDPEFLLEDLGDDEKMKESGFIVPQNIPSHSWLKRGVDPPPNRYGIKPGRHWDGVDRSNGFEKDMFKLKNEKQATEQEAYLWSVSDM
ncbi:unnamed protein product [Urochloa humidicola]